MWIMSMYALHVLYHVVVLFQAAVDLGISGRGDGLADEARVRER